MTLHRVEPLDCGPKSLIRGQLPLVLTRQNQVYSAFSSDSKAIRDVAAPEAIASGAWRGQSALLLDLGLIFLRLFFLLLL